jgi:murein DD-endopeptidase MepM/ murein hydrolase activator NlpD
MKNRSHERAFFLLLISKERLLSPSEQFFLDEHLKTCAACRSQAGLHEGLRKALRPASCEWIQGQQSRVVLAEILNAVERSKKMKQASGFLLTFAKAGLAILLIGAALWFLVNALPSLAPGSTPADTPLAPVPTPSSFPTQPSATSTPLPKATPEQTSFRRRTDVIIYRVKEGDTVFGIAETFNLNPETILFGNFEALMDNPHFLEPGMELYILPVDGVYYRWKEGDDLVEVAARFGVEPEDILNWPGNHLEPRSPEEASLPDIQPGTMLVIPGGHRDFAAPVFSEFDPPEWASLGIRRDTPYNGKKLGLGFCDQSASGVIGTGTFAWPVAVHEIKGRDSYSLYPAGEEGDPVFASDGGVILFAGWSNSYHRTLIIIDHGNGWQTAYGNLGEINVGCGESILQGSQIGTIGSPSSSDRGSKSVPDIQSGPTLQFEIIRDYTTNVNPGMYLPEP